MGNGSVKYSVNSTKLRGEEVYFARAVVQKMYNSSELINRMASEGSFSRGQYDNFLHELLDMIGRIIKEGGGISLNRRLKIVPAIKGGFESRTDCFDRKRHTFSINATISKHYIEELLPELSFERVEPELRVPHVRTLSNNVLGENRLFLDIMNNIDGKDLDVRGLEFRGIAITDRERPGNSVDISVGNLHIYRKTGKRLAFQFRRDYNIVDWLTPGLSIIFILNYFDTERELKVASRPVVTTWAIDERE